VGNELKRRNVDPLIIAELRSQLEQLDTEISETVKQRKALEVDQRLKRKCAGNAKAALKTIQDSKKKLRCPFLPK
jgi:hypothetical protein